MRVRPRFVLFALLAISLAWLAIAQAADAPSSNPATDAAKAAAPAVAQAPPAQLDFNRDIRHILSENCFKCHGFDEKNRQGGLRLDQADDAVKKLESGNRAIVPGDPAASEMVRRILSTDPDEQMPPPSSGKKVTAAQIETLKTWIAQGAKYEKHWSFVPPKRPALPATASDPAARGAIDSFILARLTTEGLKPSAEASKTALVRRATLDLTGLPPTLDEIDAFETDSSPDAYERLVDRLLASPQFGERTAVDWLDAARYADTHGYHIDSQRDMWRWREWLISALNRDMPFDEFTVDQIAGDLLPNATIAQRLASGFNRNNMINFEGGAIPEEYLTAYVIDRVNTTGTVFLGLTVGCTQCHDHKYDPITQKEYYQLFAFFNHVPEKGLDGQAGNAAPTMAAPTPRQQRQQAALKQQIANVETKIEARADEAAPAFAAWEESQRAAAGNEPPAPQGEVAHFTFDSIGAGEKRTVADLVAPARQGVLQGPVAGVPGKLGGALKFDGNAYVEAGDALGFDRNDPFSFSAWIQPATSHHGAIISRMDDADGIRGYDMYYGAGQLFVHLIHHWEDNAIRVNTEAPLAAGQWHHVVATYDGSSKAEGVKIYVDGKPAKVKITHNHLTESIKTAKPLHIGRRNPGAMFNGLIDDVRAFNRALAPEEAAQLAGADPIRPILAIAPDKRTAEQQTTLRNYYLQQVDEPTKTLAAEAARLRAADAEITKATPTTMVMQEMEKPRTTNILLRGQYDKKGDVVTAAVPAALPPLPAGAPANRLGLAEWLTSPDHPLVARVTVNRYWQSYFGSGIVKTAEDFGSQGEWPSHPELLDYLAREFIDSGWRVKAMHRAIVTSAAYRQSSYVTKALYGVDPENRLLARGPRVRLPAEFIRDGALAASGLLVGDLGGPSVLPYHPAGLWEEMAFGGGFSAQSYKQGKGADLYRRTMYTFWKRTVPPASLSTFDAPDRETCTVRRLRTNTPLQALVLMNDPTYVEAARKLAERLLREAPHDDARIELAFRLTTGRRPSEREHAIIARLYATQRARFQADKEAAKKLLGIGESQRDEALDAAELAAWTTISSTLLNLDETITKG